MIRQLHFPQCGDGFALRTVCGAVGLPDHRHRSVRGSLPGLRLPEAAVPEKRSSALKIVSADRPP